MRLAIISLCLLAACNAPDAAGPLAPMAGTYTCSQSTLTAAPPMFGQVPSTTIMTTPVAFGDLQLNGAGKYTMTGGDGAKGRYTSDAKTGALSFTGLLGAFSNTYSVNNGWTHIEFQSDSISFACSQKGAAFAGNFSVRSNAPAAPNGTDQKQAGRTFEGRLLYARREGLHDLELASGKDTFVRETQSFDVAANGEIIWVNAAGELQIGRATGPVETVSVYGRRSAPRFSPDASQIAYMGEVPPRSLEESVMGANTTANVQPLVIDRSGKVLAAFGPAYMQPAWLNDGRLVLAGSKASPAQAGVAETGIFLTDANLQSLERIDGGLELPHSPAVSADGSKIAFVSGGRIYVMRAEGGEASVLAAGQSRYIGALAWSPSGHAIAYRDNNELWIAPLKGEPQKTTHPEGYGFSATGDIVWQK